MSNNQTILNMRASAIKKLQRMIMNNKKQCNRAQRCAHYDNQSFKPISARIVLRAKSWPGRETSNQSLTALHECAARQKWDVIIERAFDC